MHMWKKRKVEEEQVSNMGADLQGQLFASISTDVVAYLVCSICVSAVVNKSQDKESAYIKQVLCCLFAACCCIPNN